MLTLNLWSLLLACFDPSIINIQLKIKSMSYIALESRAYGNVHNVFVRSPIFDVRKYARTLICRTLACSMLPWKSNVEKKNTFQIRSLEWRKCVTVKKIGNVIWKKAFLTGAQHCASLVISGSKNSRINRIN